MSATRATMSRRGLAGLVLSVALTTSLVACGVPADDEVQRIDPGRVPNHLIAPSPPAHPASPATH